MTTEVLKAHVESMKKAVAPIVPVPESKAPETKPAEVKPAESKPAEVKPAEVKPAEPQGKGANDDKNNMVPVEKSDSVSVDNKRTDHKDNDEKKRKPKSEKVKNAVYVGPLLGILLAKRRNK